MNHVVIIRPDGTALTVGDLPIELGEVRTRRASHIWPSHPVKRLAFRVLRWAFGERGRIAEKTRQWQGPWQVSFANDPGVVVFESQSRRVALDYERRVLNERISISGRCDE